MPNGVHQSLNQRNPPTASDSQSPSSLPQATASSRIPDALDASALRLRASTSIVTPVMRAAVPSPLRSVTRPRLATQRQAPLRVRKRYSVS